MNAFLLASKKLTKSGQGKTPYEYFEAFLETLKGFPVVGLSIPTFYVQYPTMDRQNLAGLFRTSKPSIRICWPNRLLPRSPAQLSHLQPKKQKIKIKTRAEARAAPAPTRMAAHRNGDLTDPNSNRALHLISRGASLEVPWVLASAKKTRTRRSRASLTCYPKPTLVRHGIILGPSRH